MGKDKFYFFHPLIIYEMETGIPFQDPNDFFLEIPLLFLVCYTSPQSATIGFSELNIGTKHQSVFLQMGIAKIDNSLLKILLYSCDLDTRIIMIYM
jgi:hypothetical protein